MNIAEYTPMWLDAFFMAPFRWPQSATLGLWIGCTFLAIYSTCLGEGIRFLLMKAHKHYYKGLQDKTMHYHKLSMQALHSGKKDAYLAANTLAHDSFGKSFFASASVGIAMLLPVPFCLGWLALRFEGIAVHTIPFTENTVGYVFIFLILYIFSRIIFSQVKKIFYCFQ